jgi:hypothetical protein
MITDRRLPGEMCLLAYDLQRNRFVGTGRLDSLVRGAALTELLAEGALAVHGRAVETAGDRYEQAVPGADPVLERVVEEVQRDGPATWEQLLQRSEETYELTRRQLVRVHPAEVADDARIGAYERAAANRLQLWSRTLLTGARLDDRDLDMLDAALVPLAAVVRLSTVASRRSWRANRGRVTTLTSRLGDAIPGFGDLIAQMRQSRTRAPAG